MSKQDELQYEQQEKRIQAQSDAFITLLTKRGILGDSRIDDAQKRAARQEKTKNCYHNTLMLLQHYRTLVWMLECFPETVAAELDRPFEGVDKLIEDVDVEVALGNKKIESRMQGSHYHRRHTGMRRAVLSGRHAWPIARQLRSVDGQRRRFRREHDEAGKLEPADLFSGGFQRERDQRHPDDPADRRCHLRLCEASR